MDADDLNPPTKKPPTLAQKLETLSVKGLETFIAEKEAEIASARAEIKRRGGALSAAEALFAKK